MEAHFYTKFNHTHIYVKILKWPMHIYRNIGWKMQSLGKSSDVVMGYIYVQPQVWSNTLSLQRKLFKILVLSTTMTDGLYTQFHINVCTHVQIHVHSDRQTHTHTHKHTCMHTQTHTCTHLQSSHKSVSYYNYIHITLYLHTLVGSFQKSWLFSIIIPPLAHTWFLIIVSVYDIHH